ncbi:MAG: hypothetical protein HQM11_05055 [SAR324 cluster bacterium]|nr:hypothetical protein [SAR324 cluster bacterium]
MVRHNVIPVKTGIQECTDGFRVKHGMTPFDSLNRLLSPENLQREQFVNRQKFSGKRYGGDNSE